MPSVENHVRFCEKVDVVQANLSSVDRRLHKLEEETLPNLQKTIEEYKELPKKEAGDRKGKGEAQEI